MAVDGKSTFTLSRAEYPIWWSMARIELPAQRETGYSRLYAPAYLNYTDLNFVWWTVLGSNQILRFFKPTL